MKNPPNGKERRAEPRLSTNMLIYVRLFVGDRVYDGHLVDLNSRGAYIATGMALETGTVVRLEIRLPDGQCAKPIRAVVARSKQRLQGDLDAVPAGIGVCFVAGTEEEQAEVQYTVKATLALDLLSFDKSATQWMYSTDSRPDTSPS